MPESRKSKGEEALLYGRGEEKGKVKRRRRMRRGQRKGKERGWRMRTVGRPEGGWRKKGTR